MGAGTVRADDPALTRRWIDADGVAREDCGWRFVFDGALATASGDAAKWPRVFTDSWRQRTVVVTSAAADEGTRTRLESAGVRVWRQETTRGAAGWAEFARRCAAERISGVYVEGGAELLADATKARALAHGFWYRSARFGDAEWGGRVEWAFEGEVKTERLGADELLSGRMI